MFVLLSVIGFTSAMISFDVAIWKNLPHDAADSNLKLVLGHEPDNRALSIETGDCA